VGVSTGRRTGGRALRPGSHATGALPGTLQFLQLLWALNQALELASKRMAQQLRVTGPQRLVIRLIGRFPGISAGALAATLRTDPSTLTGVLKRLQAGRLVRRVRDTSDGRRVRLSLTTRGRTVDRIKAGTVEHAVSLGLRGTSPRDVAATGRVMRQLASALLQNGGASARDGPGSARDRRAARAGARSHPRFSARGRLF
jgi:DNA-binding MarR family transcriptional regulator